MECVQLQSYQSMIHYHHLDTRLSSAFQFICNYQDLLYEPYPLF